MPLVPKYNNKPLKPIYNPMYRDGPASIKQKNYIATICERRSIPLPDMKTLAKGQASQLISRLVD